MGQLDREQELRRALDNEEFSLHYQPVVRLGDRAIVGFEALVRWLHPNGIILPEVFLPQVEAAGLMPQLGRRVIETAAAALRRLEVVMPLRPGLESSDLFMSVNLSAGQLDDPHLLDAIEGALATNRLEPGRLRLEISEANVAMRIDDVARLVSSCAEVGVGVSIDQFGTGPSALSALSRLPVGGVKLARCFALDLARHPRGAEVLRAVARFARQLGMACVACCIEDYRQAAIARDLGVEFGQGHFFGTAMPLMVASSFVRRHMERSFEEAGGALLPPEFAVPPVSA
jgi:EAL domain-containing protein (putative c-di-GMP-specific phosphodiesterase class I)